MTDRRTVQTLCRLCDDRCAVNVHLEKGRIVDIDGYAEHPWNRGRLCVKARAAMDMVYHPQRILKPLKRTASGWQEIGLEQALDEIAGQLDAIIDRQGAHAVGIWNEEDIGFGQQEVLACRFLQAIGSPNYFCNDSQRYKIRYSGYRLVEGAWSMPDYENARCIVIWGANPPYSHPNMTRPIMSARRRGARLIVVDPRFSTIARKADLHAQLKPGTDGALAWGIIHQLVTNQWYDRPFVKKYTLGFEALAAYAERFTPATVEEETSVPAPTVREIARAMAWAAPATAVYVGSGPERHENGINNVRAVACLDGLMASVDRQGGNRLVEPFECRNLTNNWEFPLRHMDLIAPDHSSVVCDLRRERRMMSAFDNILSGKPYPLRALLLTAANPALTIPNSEKVRRTLASLDLVVVRDLFLTETAELAHYVLPAATFLERTELHCHSMYQVVSIARRVLHFDGVQDDYSFWRDLAARLGCGNSFPWRDETEFTRWILEPTGLSLEDLEAHPEGIPYTPVRYEKWRERSFATPSGKIEFASRYLADLGYAELPEYSPPDYLGSPDPAYPFVLIIGGRKLLFDHSRFHNIPRFCTVAPQAEVEMNPEDAYSLGLADGDMVRVSSRIGSMDIPVKITGRNEILAGMLQINHGWKNANINLLTHDDNFDPQNGLPLWKTVQVRVEKA